MGNLSFTLLGPPQVRHSDQVLLFSTRKELALLIYLAMENRCFSFSLPAAARIGDMKVYYK